MIVKKTARGWTGDCRVSFPPFRIRKNFQANTKKEAEAFFNKHVASLRPENKVKIPDKIKLQKAMELYWKRESLKKAKSSQHNDILVFRLLTEVLGECFLDEVTSLSLTSLYEVIHEKEWTKETANRKLGVVKSFFKWCHSHELITSNPSQSLKKLKKGTTREARALSKKEIETLLGAANPTLRLQILIALYTGLRRGEVASLKWSQFDFDSLNFRVGGDSDFSTKSGKTKLLPIPEALITELKKWKLQSNVEWLFPNKNKNAAIHPSVITCAFSRLKKSTGLKDVRFHDTRATCGTLLAECGMGDAAIAKQLGHSSLAMARKYSNKVDQDTLIEGNSRVSEKLSFIAASNL